MNRLRLLLAFLAVVAAILVVSLVTAQHDPTKSATSQTAASAVASATPAGGLVQPTPVIPLPTNCPPQTAAQIDNVARYGFCTPVGWGAYNENNSLAPTYLMLPRASNTPIFSPADFDLMKIMILLDFPLSGDLPGECRESANDSIGGQPAHHCTATLDPATNLYHGVRQEYWIVDLANGQKFDITAFVDADASADEQTTMNTIVHSVTPPKLP